MKVLIANRGEIARRIVRAITRLDWQAVRVHALGERPDTPDSIELPSTGVAGYLDIDGLISVARGQGCDLVHPGYGFLSESAAFARTCSQAGIGFVGPSPEALELFGDKARARRHALAAGVPVLHGTGPNATLAEARALLDNYPDGIMIKAMAGGGGRGMRRVTDPAAIAAAYQRCRSEAARAFGNDTVYAEQLLTNAKHIEIQVVGDGSGAVVTLGERECSLQRRNQKLIEYTPSPALDSTQRAALEKWARDLTASIGYRGLATAEFVVAAKPGGSCDTLFHAAFIEVNPRLQVEHTITEEVTGIDLVAAQLRLATGATLAELDLTNDVHPRGDVFAIQARVNAETAHAGQVVPTTGTVTTFKAPAEVRVDTGINAGSIIDGRFDSLLAKVITRTEGTFSAACTHASAALRALRIEGIQTNQDLLVELLTSEAVQSGAATTTLVDRMQARTHAPHQDNGRVEAHMNGTVIAVDAAPGDTVGARQAIITIESMKMEHPVAAGFSGIVERIEASVGDQVRAGQLLAVVQPDGTVDSNDNSSATIDLDPIRPDLGELHERMGRTRDAARPAAVAKRRRQGHLTAREWIATLVEEGAFVEYGALAVAAQRSRRNLADLMDNTPADGIITGLGKVGTTCRQCAILAYDYTVLAGTQGYFSHKKTDRLLELAAKRKLPVIIFTEGGGGRPGDSDTENLMAAWLTVSTFATMGALSGKVPLIGIATGRCFAGNAALLGLCDVIIATADANIGMAGPAMIEGGGLGVFSPEQIGPTSVQAPNGVVDIVVDDDAQAIATAKAYLSYLGKPHSDWEADDQRLLRHVIGENRKQVYDMRRLISTLADHDSVLELRHAFGVGAITALVRIEGRAYGLVANNPAHLGGAIDADAADKMARFLQLCDAYGLPVISLCDTPGFMVGPESEKSATVRHFSRMFVVGAQLTVPMLTIVVRKGYGLGAQSMTAGGFAQTTATIAWPTGEIGAMGLEGGVRLGYKKELAAITDPDARRRRYEALVAERYAAGKAINSARLLELDAVIDPCDTRRWIVNTLGNFHPDSSRPTRFIDTW